MENKRIVVVGDFDADGATSCAVMMRSLKAFGLDNVDYLVPNRFDFGYGLSRRLSMLRPIETGSDRDG